MKNYDELIEKGINHYENKKYKEAVAVLTKAINKNPSKDRAYVERGYTYGFLDKKKKSIMDFIKAININNKNHIAYILRGMSYEYFNEFKKAENDYKKAIELNPQRNIYIYYLGILYKKMEKYKKSEEQFKKIIENSSKKNDIHQKALFNQGIIFGEEKKYKKALDNFNKLVEMNPNNEKYLFNLGVVYLKNEKYKKAIEEFTKSIDNIKEDKNIKKYYKVANKLINKSENSNKELYNYLVKLIKKNKIGFPLLTNLLPGINTIENNFKKLYHYTSLNALKSIIENKEIHVSRVDFLNDPAERSYIQELIDSLCNDLNNFLKSKNIKKEPCSFLGKLNLFRESLKVCVNLKILLV